jgi:hypothetical protein
MADITIEGGNLAFPAICPVCQMSASKLYPYRQEQVIQRVTFLIPYCDRHGDQLVQSDKKLKSIRTGLLITAVMLWAFAVYVVLRILPGLKIMPGETPIAWIFSIIVIMVILAAMLLIGTGGILIKLLAHAFPVIVRHFFETGDAKAARTAITVKDFDLLRTTLAAGPAPLKRVVFSVAEPKYAQELHKLNPGSKLTEPVRHR